MGFERDGAEQSGEPCVAESFGDRIGPGRSVFRTGVKAHHDPRLVDEVVDVPLPIDATRPHEYGVDWDGTGARFLVDGEVVLRTEQTADHPMMLMLDLFEFRGAAVSPYRRPRRCTGSPPGRRRPTRGPPTGRDIPAVPLRR